MNRTTRLLLAALVALSPFALAADDEADPGVPETTIEEAPDADEEAAASEQSAESKPEKSRIKRPRKLGNVFRPSEEITADSAITFPSDI